MNRSSLVLTVVVCVFALSIAAAWALATVADENSSEETLLIPEAGLEVALPEQLTACGTTLDFIYRVCSAANLGGLGGSNQSPFIVVVWDTEAAKGLGYTRNADIAAAQDEIVQVYLHDCVGQGVPLRPPAELNVREIDVDEAAAIEIRASCAGGSSTQVLLAVGLPDGRLLILASDKVYGDDGQREQSEQFTRLVDGIRLSRNQDQ